VDPSVSVKTAVKPRQTAAITEPTTIQQFLRKLLHNDNQTFISMARNGGRVIIEGVNDGNFSKIVQCLDEQAKTSIQTCEVSFTSESFPIVGTTE
jgi:hypothetical protein